jgi:hypothetical protein
VCGKTPLFLKSFPPHTEYLPRQARETHRKRRGKRRVLTSNRLLRCSRSANGSVDSAERLLAQRWHDAGTKTRVFAPSCTQNDRFAKTGSGQT